MLIGEVYLSSSKLLSGCCIPSALLYRFILKENLGAGSRRFPWRLQMKVSRVRRVRQPAVGFHELNDVVSCSFKSLAKGFRWRLPPCCRSLESLPRCNTMRAIEASSIPSVQPTRISLRSSLFSGCCDLSSSPSSRSFPNVSNVKASASILLLRQFSSTVLGICQ